MELGKQLLALSALAIGLLIGIFGHKDVTQFWLWLFAGMAYLACGALILIIFHMNTVYIGILLENHQTADDDEEKVILGQRSTNNKAVKLVDQMAFLLFLAGTTLTLFLAISQSGFMNMKGI